VTAGTTNQAAMKSLSDKQKLDIKLLIGADHDQSLQMLTEGKADAFATDDVLLHGLVATTKSGDRYQVVASTCPMTPMG